MKNARRLLSLIMALMMCLSLLPVGAMAEESAFDLDVDGAPNTNYTLTGNQADDIVAVAIAQKGKKAADFGFSSAWCAYFVSWCGKKAASNLFSKSFGTAKDMAVYMCNHNQGKLYYFSSAVKTSLDNKNAGTPDYSTGNYISTSKSSFTPRKGDLICFNWTSSGGFYWDHIGIVTSINGSTVYYADGNGGSGTTLTRTVRTGLSYSKTNSQIIAYIRPNYSSGTSTTTNTPATISNAVYPSGTLTKGKSFGLRGVINSSSNITKVNAYVYNAAGGTEMSYTASPNKTSYNIQTDGLNDKFTFGTLGNGSYRYYVTATNSYGVRPLIDSNFVIGSPTTYTIKYNANGGSGAPGNQTKTHGTTLKLSTTKPTRTGYTFLGWSTNSGATTATYSAGGNYTANSAATLYAVWSQNILTMKYNVNEGTITSSTYSANSTGNVVTGTTEKVSKWEYGYDAAYGPINASTFGLARTGYTFVGWSLTRDGSSGIIDQDAATRPEIIYPNLKNGNATITLYAIWKANTPKITLSKSSLTLDLNGTATGKIYYYYSGDTEDGYYISVSNPYYNVAANDWGSSEESVIVTAKSVGTTTISISLIENNTEKVLSTATCNVTVIDFTPTYTITYNANGGSGAPGSQTKRYGIDLTLSSTKPVRAGYTFLGWSTSSSSATATYSDGGNYASNSSATLYAVWKANATPAPTATAAPTPATPKPAAEKTQNTITAKTIKKTINTKNAQSFYVNATALGGAKLTYKSSNSKITVTSDGKVTIPKGFIGKTVITITAAETKTYKTTTKKITLYVDPTKTTIASAKNTASRKIVVKWKKNATVTGYEIQYSLNKNFTKGTNKSKIVKTKTTTSATLTGLTKGRTYYVRMRSYRIVGGDYFYSPWSPAKTVKITK